MKESTARALRALFYLYVGFTLIHIAYVVHHEPFAFDAWNVAVDTEAKPASVGNFFEFWKKMYTSSNPRIGQPFAYLAYKIDGFAEVGTPLAYLAIVIAAFVLGVGRWPSRKNGRDLATIAIGIGCLWIASENFPAYMFCRAYATNYVWSIAAQLWFLVPLRLHARGLLDRSRPVTVPKLVAYGVLGVVAGMGNEHVGPTLILFVVGYGILTLRRKQREPLIWIGIAGVIIGYALIFFAPGQSQRYEGLAERYSLFEQIRARGFERNIELFIDFLGGIAPLMFIIFGAMVAGMLSKTEPEKSAETIIEQRRDTLVFLGVVLLAATLITITIFASPKTGPRFFMHAGALMLAALLGVLQTFVSRTRAFAVFVALAVIVSSYAAARTIRLYTRMSAASDARLEELASARPNSVYTVNAWEPVDETWWALGDDVRDQKKAELIAKYFGLERVVYRGRGGEKSKALGLSDVRLQMDYAFERPMCIDQIDKLDLQPFLGRDVDALNHAFLDIIARIEILGNRPKWVDLRVTFAGEDPPLPKKPIFVGRWRDGQLEYHTAKLKRVRGSKNREILVPDDMKTEPWEIYLVQVGKEPRLVGTSQDAKPPRYVPPASGLYWTLACKPDHCFVLMAVWHSI